MADDDEKETDRVLRRGAADDIVPVHSSTGNASSARDRRQSEDRPAMKIKNGESSQQSQDDAVNISNWLWGRTLGDRKTLLLFRSCALAPRISDSAASEDSLFNALSTSEIFDDDDEEFKPFGSPVASPESREARRSTVSPKKAIETTQSKWKSNFKNVIQDINRLASKGRQFRRPTPEAGDPSLDAGHAMKKGKLTSKCASLPSEMNHLNDRDAASSLDSVFSYGLMSSSFDNVTIPARNKMPAAILNVTYKSAMTETKLLSKLLRAHGMENVDPQSRDFNLLWSGLHPKPDVLRSLASHQRVNHFPRSYELTRKDKLFKNIEKMQHLFKNFDFIPVSFLMPLEYRELCSTHYRIKGPWIVKPAASSRGRGIYIVNAPDQIPKGESVVVAKYIDKPLLVDGHKCDLRIYVLVTSFDPLLIYIYEEGLARFATVKYDRTNKSLWNPCMHLCNYSINKYHSDYISCEDPSAENVGHKWTLSAFLRHLRKEGHDVSALMTSIEDVVIKSIFSCAQSIASASRMFVPHFNNCFELYGFDILIDENLKPWLLEINLSPSLGCDSPLDVRLKAALLADTLNLVGIPAVDPAAANEQNRSRKANSVRSRSRSYRRVHSAENMESKKKSYNSESSSSHYSDLTNDEIRLLKYIKEQYERRGGYVRIFPSQDSWRKYSQYLDSVTGVPISSLAHKTTNLNTLNTRNYNLFVHRYIIPNFEQTSVAQNTNFKHPDRLKRYERVLPACNRVSLDSAESPRSKKPTTEVKSTKVDIQRQILQGAYITINDSRRAFATFLVCVLRRISKSTTDQSVQHAEFILRFLKKVSHTIKMPYTIKAPSQKLSDKDKTAIIAKQLNDFLHIYYKETDLSDDKKTNLENVQFDKFVCSASEDDLEEILLTILRKEGSVVPFLGDKQNPMCVDIPPSTFSHIFNKESAFRHQLLRYLTYITPVHSRRYKPIDSSRFPAIAK